MNIEIFFLDINSSFDTASNTPFIIVPESNQSRNGNKIVVSSTESTGLLAEIAKRVTSEYFLLQVKPGQITITEAELQQWLTEAIENNCALSYSHYREKSDNEEKGHPVIEYSPGSIRDDFNFGPLVMVKTTALKHYLESEPQNYRFAGWYDFRLYISRNGGISLSDNYFYTYNEPDQRASGAKQFDYVNPMNRERQIEMEQAATHHLKEIGALVSPPFLDIDFSETKFEVEASVIIPVLNREKTIADAIRSVLDQQTKFPFNLIVIDNHSTDRTAEIIESYGDERIIHMIPERNDLGIGGCWNEGINHPQCGRFAIQLDSDDLYSDGKTLQRIVDKFYETKCVMVIGSYQMVNFKLEEIPPGIIDHREWSDDNGPNNALRINGLGAPRAFYTPIIRQIGFPNVSYGEDYAVAIAISGTWKVGRIYEPVYLCRRWDNNTDSNLSIEKTNAHNRYKDSLRSAEIDKRKESIDISH
jgi:hypothetical protein